MKKILMILCFGLFACDNHVYATKVNQSKLQINGKDCDIVKVNNGWDRPVLWVVDCGSSVTTHFQSGKQNVNTTVVSSSEPINKSNDVPCCCGDKK